ncbi:SlyX family protein [Ensifer sp. BR816]|uniref:SlyX family protein n=1 Tax=Rhizobium sp. (strain BR816) TaxID=1057002 RepID=UPI00036A3B62|nr:SlyX family protein [Ensifer sp. BR816]
MSDMDKRIVRLEEMAAHQARVIEELSEQLAEQWKVVEQTRAKLDRLTERFLSLEEQAQEAVPVTRPPHY